MTDKFTNVLDEKIYYASDTDDKETTYEQVENFFREVHDHRRDDPIEGGFQASMVIYPHMFAAKSNANDGYGGHQCCKVNLTKFINGDTTYLTERGAKNPQLYMGDLSQLIKNGVEVSLLSGEEHLMVAILASRDINSIYQLEVIKNVLDVCSELKNNGSFKTIEIGFRTPCIKVDYGELDSAKHDEITDVIANEEKIVSSR